MFDDFIEANKDKMVSSLQELLCINSVQGEKLDGKPFGEGPAEALQYVLDIARQHGLETSNVDGYAGHVEYGQGDEYVAVLSHLDVVPVGANWTYPPFAAEIHEGKIYARGAIDDKGPALSVLWALLALQDAGIRLKRKIRLVFGLNEESGWECVRHYFSKQPLPLGGFTPDADFPLIHAEKGVLTLRLQCEADKDCMSPNVIQFEGGSRANMVPDYAYALVDCHSETAALEWEQKLYRDARQKQIEVEVNVSGSHIQAVVRGVSAHGSTPELGTNAILQLATLLSAHSVSNSSMWRAIASQDLAGRGLGIEASDSVTGSLTVNLGRASLDKNTYAFLFNIRYPIDLTKDELYRRCVEYISDKWAVRIEENLDPLYVDENHPVVQTLCQVYEQNVGEPARLLTTGGATYARAIPNSVAFGPLFPGQPDLAHQRDECFALSDYLKCIKIYAHAILELGNTL